MPEDRERHSKDRELELEQDRDAVYATLRKLVESLPKCDECSKPATRAFERGAGRWCDDHKSVIFGQNTRRIYSEDAPDYPRAEALREAMKLLGME